MWQNDDVLKLSTKARKENMTICIQKYVKLTSIQDSRIKGLTKNCPREGGALLKWNQEL